MTEAADLNTAPIEKKRHGEVPRPIFPRNKGAKAGYAEFAGVLWQGD